MISLFLRRDINSMPAIKDNRLRYIKNRLIGELNNVKEYYRNRNGKVKNSNMLVSLITTVSPGYDKDIWEYARLLDATASFTSKNFDIASNINSGKILDSVIFGNNSKEIFIYLEEDFDLMEVDANWKDLEPIKVLSFDNYDMSMITPNIRYDFDDDTLSIFSIDVRMMSIQYRYWALERLSNDFDTDPATFVYRYVFPNMLNSIVDITILNRLINLSNSFTMQHNYNKHPFNVLDLNSMLDSILESTLKHIKNENKSYSNILSNIPVLTKDNAYDLLLNGVGFNTNKQNTWAIWLSFLPYISMLLDISSDKTFKRNRDTLNELRILIKSIEREHIMDDKLDGILNMIYDMNIDNIKQTIGAR